MDSEKTQLERHNDLVERRKQQPYRLVLQEVRLVIDKDVFPPECGYTSVALAQASKKYSGETALDMGCGSGFLALLMRKHGFKNVWATDVHLPAIHCTKKNIANNPELAPVTVLQGDLFQPIPAGLKFDLIIFNHPYYPAAGEPVFGCNIDGGREILMRFFEQVANHLTKTGVILMPYSSISSGVHDPKVILKSNEKFDLKILWNAQYDGLQHFVYEIKLRC